MILPEPQGRPIWEPVIIAAFLALVLVYDADDLVPLVQGRMYATGVARAVLEAGAALMMVWGLGKSLVKAATWTPSADDAA
jgi:hypothetical protein